MVYQPGIGARAGPPAAASASPPPGPRATPPTDIWLCKNVRVAQDHAHMPLPHLALLTMAQGHTSHKHVALQESACHQVQQVTYIGVQMRDL
eukprot:1161622-Pelagomonas_calceolata.AAC.4